MHQPHQNQSDQKGFTIIELLVALGVFSVILFLISIGFIQVMRVYQQGISSRSTQQAARFVMDEIGKSVRGSSVILRETDGGNVYLCLEKTAYVHNTADFSLERQVFNDITCSDAEPDQINSQESEYIVAPSSSLAVSRFDVSTFHPDGSGDPRSVEVDIRIVTRNDLVDASGQCDDTRRGVEYCSSTNLRSIFSLRKSTKKNTPDFSRDSSNTTGSSTTTPPLNPINIANSTSYDFNNDEDDRDFTVQSGNDRLLLVAIAAENNGVTTVNSVEYRGNPLSVLARESLTNTANSCDLNADQIAEVWYLPNPPVGSGELKIEWQSGNPGTSVGVVQFNNANGTPTSVRRYEERCSNGVSISGSGGQVGSYAVGVTSIGSPSSITTGPGQNEVIEHYYTGGGVVGLSYKELSATDLTGFNMSESFSSEANRAIYLNFLINPL